MVVVRRLIQVSRRVQKDPAPYPDRWADSGLNCCAMSVGWAPVPQLNPLAPKADPVSNLGGDDDYSAFQGNQNPIGDTNTTSTATPTDIQYRPTGGKLTLTEAKDAFCFVAGTLLETATGPRAGEHLQIGDPVIDP